MQHLGKIGEQGTGDIKRDLDQASMTIDMLDMLQKKCAGNMTPEEEQLLTHIVSELKLNYIDELGRSKSSDSAESKDDPKETDSQESN